MALSDPQNRLSSHLKRVTQARRPLDRAYAYLSLLFVFALAAVVFVGVIQASPSARETGIGWFINPNQKGIVYQQKRNDALMAAAASPDQIGFERQFYTLLNKSRVERGLPPLKKDQYLTAAARDYSRSMRQTLRFDPLDAHGRSPEDRAISAGYIRPQRVLEALGEGFEGPDQLLDALWADSNTAAILSSREVSEVGVGYAFIRMNRGIRHFWVVDVGRRSGLAFAVVVNNGSESTNSAQVTLYVEGKDWAQEMMVSNTPDFQGAVWKPYTEYQTWELSEGTGPKTIYVALRGPENQEVRTSGEIALDATAKGVKPGAPYEDTLQAPRPPILRAPAGEIAVNGGSLPPLPPVQLAGAGANALAPGYYQTSEFMLGKVAVGIIMPQCNGTFDKCTETWTPEAMDKVVNQINIGTGWWVKQMSGRVSFVFDQQRQAATGYEPVNHPQTDEKLWISDVMTHLGFNGANYFEQVYAYNNWMRQKYGTDWAFTIFVANSKETRTGTFSNGYFAYSYVPGPFTIVTYDNDGYTINNMAAVIAHETGHIFGALDQYAGAKIACTATSGYLTLPNQNSQQNCTSNMDSIMRGGLTPYVNHLIDPFALGMVGGRVSGSGDLPDPINTIPSIVLNPVTSPTTRTNPSITGTAQDQPFVPPSGNSVTINYITKVKYRVDGGNWLDARPADGSTSFGKVTQNFVFTPSLSPGSHVIEVQAINRVGNVSPATKATVVVEAPAATVPPVVVQRVNPPVPSVAPGEPAQTPAPPVQPPAAPGTLTLAINAGSTTFSLPFSNWKASSLIQSINEQGGSATEVDQWTGTEWEAFALNVSGKDFPIQAGTGYILRADSASRWRVPITPSTPIKSIRLDAGWTMLGVPACKDGAESCYTASTLAAAINSQGGDVVEINRWVDGAWSSYQVGFPFNDFKVYVGQGYFVRSNKAVDWSP